jgi:hypothetical protein
MSAQEYVGRSVTFPVTCPVPDYTPADAGRRVEVRSERWRRLMALESALEDRSHDVEFGSPNAGAVYANLHRRYLRIVAAREAAEAPIDVLVYQGPCMRRKDIGGGFRFHPPYDLNKALKDSFLAYYDKFRNEIYAQFTGLTQSPCAHPHTS